VPITVNFIVWGLIHGAALVFESTFLGRKLRTFWAPLQHLYALGVILVGWVFFRSPSIHFALVFLRRLFGDTRGLKILPFELTSPLPFVEPTFVIALLAGILFSFPVGRWLDGSLKKLVEDKIVLRIAVQVFSDLFLLFILVVSIAATISSTFSPGIYGAF